MDRRKFMSWVGVGFLASSLPVAIAACTSGGDGKNGESSGEETTSAQTDIPESPGGFVAVGTLADLDSQGSITDNKFVSGKLVVFRDPDNSDNIIALDATCPHSGCVAEWKTDEGALLCPCHGSKFKADGSVINGPATTPLSPLETKTEGDSVLVKAS